jgi:hypothetical protein
MRSCSGINVFQTDLLLLFFSNSGKLKKLFRGEHTYFGQSS